MNTGPNAEVTWPDGKEKALDKMLVVIKPASGLWKNVKVRFNLTVPELLYNRGEIYNLSVARGTLTPEEIYKIREHMIHTIMMLESMAFPPAMDRVAEIAGGHHETLDGRGYPRGLTAEQLSIPARILAIADIFEALTAGDRPYKRAMNLSTALGILGRMSLDGHVDPDIFDVFIRERVYLDYARRFLREEQIDTIDEAAIPGYRP